MKKKMVKKGKKRKKTKKKRTTDICVRSGGMYEKVCMTNRNERMSNSETLTEIVNLRRQIKESKIYALQKSDD